MGKKYPCVEVHLDKVKHNVQEILKICKPYGISVTAVSKVFCAKKPIVKVIVESGIEMISDSRIKNLKKLEDFPCKKMLIRVPMISELKELVKYCHMSLHSEWETIEALNEEAKKQNKIHQIILMVDLGDLREGLLPKDVEGVVEKTLTLSNVKLCGFGTNLTCYGAVIPDEENLGRLIALKEEIEEKFKITLPIVSGGNSSSLYMAIKGNMPKGVTQLRIGEAIALANETAYGEKVPNCHSDIFVLQAQIVELKEKPSIPTGNIGRDAFGQVPHFEDKGIRKRAILAVGKQDINIDGLTPLDSKVSILGGSSDHLIIDVTESDKCYKIGDVLEFTLDYGALLKVMTSEYVKKYYI